MKFFDHEKTASHLWSYMQEDHSRVNQLVKDYLFGQELTPHRYQAYLKRLVEFYTPMEAALLSVSGLERLGLSVEARAKLPWLISDLLHVGGMIQDFGPMKAPLLDTAQALGVLYVLEGATIGGQKTAQKLRTLGRSETAFFTGYGSHTREMWQSYTWVLEAFVGQHPDLLKQVEQGVAQTLHSFEAFVFEKGGYQFQYSHGDAALHQVS
jgi:heme oxygenase